MAVSLILFADFLGSVGANARKSDNSEDYEDYTAEDSPIIRSSEGSDDKTLPMFQCSSALKF